MARLHSRKKGKSGSQKPLEKKSPNWLVADGRQIEEKIAALAKEGKRESEIGRILRDTLGVTSTKFVLGKKISQILAEQKLAPSYPADLIDLIRRAVNLRKHIKSNSRDTANKTKLVHIESKIKRLVKYYRGKKLPAKWKYEPEKAALLVK
ncbi:30S ribosomal protein S15 [Candidatus Micrarchaeota archaeon]|nr:30S ribosomal protein S15 [Candidatus Micrarchaeota archaeon]